MPQLANEHWMNCENAAGDRRTHSLALLIALPYVPFGTCYAFGLQFNRNLTKYQL